MLIEQISYPQREINNGKIILVGLLIIATLAILVKMKEDNKEIIKPPIT